MYNNLISVTRLIYSILLFTSLSLNHHLFAFLSFRFNTCRLTSNTIRYNAIHLRNSPLCLIRQPYRKIYNFFCPSFFNHNTRYSMFFFFLHSSPTIYDTWTDIYNIFNYNSTLLIRVSSVHSQIWSWKTQVNDASERNSRIDPLCFLTFAFTAPANFLRCLKNKIWYI